MTVKEAILQTGDNFRQIRTQRGFSIQTLSVLSHIDEEMIKGIEEGTADFPVKVLFALAAELNVDFLRIMVDNLTI